MVPMFLLVVVSGCVLADGLPLTEETEKDAILKRLETKIEREDAVIKERLSKNEAIRRDMSELVERMDTQSNKTEEVLKAMRYTELMSASGDKAVRDLPFIMMCAYQNHWKTTGIIPYEELTLDYTNCDRPSGGCSAMDIASGTFTAQTGGLYTVTFSGNADLISTDALPSTQYLSSSQRFRTERKSCFQRVSQRE